MDLGLKGKTALVLGGSSGIGLGIAECLSDSGANVILASRNMENLEKAKTSLLSKQPEAKVSLCEIDLSNEKNIRESFQSLLSKTAIDIVVNNTGGPAAGQITEMPLSDWDNGYQQLIRSVILTTELALPAMIERGWGRIINVTSTSAKEMIPKLAISGTFRAGLSSWVKSISKEISSKGILVNNLLPGPTDTPRLQDLEKKSPDFFHYFKSEMAVGRIPSPLEIGKVAAFLCSNANTVVTGTDIVADGGYTKAL